MLLKCNLDCENQYCLCQYQDPFIPRCHKVRPRSKFLPTHFGMSPKTFDGLSMNHLEVSIMDFEVLKIGNKKIISNVYMSIFVILGVTIKGFRTISPQYYYGSRNLFRSKLVIFSLISTHLGNFVNK